MKIEVFELKEISEVPHFQEDVILQHVTQQHPYEYIDFDNLPEVAIDYIQKKYHIHKVRGADSTGRWERNYIFMDDKVNDWIKQHSTVAERNYNKFLSERDKVACLEKELNNCKDYYDILKENVLKMPWYKRLFMWKRFKALMEN